MHIQFDEMLHDYERGMAVLLEKISVIQDQSFIEHIRTRIKTPESIARKLHNLDLDVTAQNARTRLFDIAGIRIITPFAKDIYFLAKLLRAIPGICILKEKDYIGNPKPSGYRSYHIIAEVEGIPVEIQLRTEAMNFWATLEHKARYKYDDHIPDHLNDELVAISKRIDELDNRMYLIHEIITLINEEA